MNRKGIAHLSIGLTGMVLLLYARTAASSAATVSDQASACRSVEITSTADALLVSATTLPDRSPSGCGPPMRTRAGSDDAAAEVGNKGVRSRA